MEKKLFYVREFLNEPGFGSAGSIFAELARSKDDKTAWASLTIAACSRAIDLDISTYDPEFDPDNEAYDNTLKKLELIENTVRGLRLALVRDAESRSSATIAED